MREETREEVIQIILPSAYRIFVSKAEFADIVKEPNGKMFIRIQNCESMAIKREKKGKRGDRDGCL